MNIEKESVSKGAQMYGFLAQRYIIEKTGLEKIDKRLSNSRTANIPVPLRKMEEEQRSSQAGLTYIYIKNKVHMERLSNEDRELFSAAANDTENEALIKKAMEIVQKSYGEVLGFSEEPNKMIELYPSIKGEGVIPANAIVFVLATYPSYNSDGNLKSWEEEEKRQNLMYSLKKQLESVCEDALENPVRFFVRY